MILSHKDRKSILQKITCCKIVTASELSLSSAHKTSVYKANPAPPYFFHLKSFLWKGPLTVKVRKKTIDQILVYIGFCLEIRAHLGHLFP